MKLIFTSHKENVLIEEMVNNGGKKKIVFVADSVPLISNLNLYENITLPMLYHGIEFEESMIDAELEKFGLLGKKYFRKSGLDEIELFFAKFLMCKFYRPDVLVFVYQFHHFSGKREKFYEFFNDENDKKFVIIEREIYKSLLTSKLKNFEEMSFEKWLKSSLNI